MSSTRRTHRGRIIETSIDIKTTPERAWAAWADPQDIANWFVDRAEGVAAPGEVMTWFFDTFNYRQPVPIVEADRGQTFVVGSGDQPGPQGLPYLMEITISRAGGTTRVHLVNSGFSPDAKFDDEFEGVVSGWKMALATMKHWLEHYDGRARSHTLALQPAAFSWELLQPLFRTPEGRRQWMEPSLPSDSGVLVDTGREVLLAWPERDAVVGLKAFRSGGQPMIALDLSRWPPTSAAEPFSSPLTDALSRLKSLLG